MSDAEIPLKVVGFSGPRHAPTPQDWAQLEALVLELLQHVRERKLGAIAFAAVLSGDHCRIATDWLMLPGTNRNDLVAATHYLAHRMTALQADKPVKIQAE